MTQRTVHCDKCDKYAYTLADTDGTEIVYTYAESRSDMLTDFNGEAIAYDANGCRNKYYIGQKYVSVF